jgi:hypothetical protein
MMYAFGDVRKPEAESVALVEDMALSFLVDLCHRARPQPHKIPIPNNQNTITAIASGLSQQMEGASVTSMTGASSGSIQQANSTKSSIASRSIKDARTATNAAAATTHTSVPPRLAAHPYIARPRMTVDDLKFACRKDAKKSSRIEELLYLDKVITDAQKAFRNPEEDAAES